MEPYFHLKGSFKTSADATPGRADIEKFIEEAKTTILQKGVPAGRGAKIVGWDIRDNSIFFDIESDRYLRAHYSLPADTAVLHRPGPLAIRPGEICRELLRGQSS